jgi:hypothetical protein
MQARNQRSWHQARGSLSAAVSAVGWRKLLLWSAVAAVPVAIATNTFWLMIETALPPSSAKSLELLPYLGGMFLATVVGQLLGPYAALRWELEKLEPGHRVWFGTKNPLPELNNILWNMGTADEANRFRNAISTRGEDFATDILDKRRTQLLTTLSRNLESVPSLFHIPGVTRKDVVEFGAEPREDSLVSLARGLREVGWGKVDMQPSLDWVAFTPLSLVGTLVLLALMVVALALLPASRPGSDGIGYFFVALAVQSPFYLAAIALSMLPSAGRRSGIVQSALPTGLHTDGLDESLALASNPLERIRLFLGALSPDDQKALLEATHFALWKTLRTCKPGTRARAPHP